MDVKPRSWRNELTGVLMSKEYGEVGGDDDDDDDDDAKGCELSFFLCDAAFREGGGVWPIGITTWNLNIFTRVCKMLQPLQR